VIERSLGSSAGATRAIDELLTLEDTEEIVVDPEYAIWRQAVESAVMSGSTERLRRVTSDFWRFHIALALRKGRAAEYSFPLHDDGELLLPGVSGVLTFGRALAGATVRVRLEPGPPIESKADLASVFADAADGRSKRVRLQTEGADERVATFEIFAEAGGIHVARPISALVQLLAAIAGARARLYFDSVVAEDVAAAITDLERVDAGYSHGVRAIVRWVVPVHSDALFSTSHSSLPGVIFVRLKPGDVLWNSELILHEAAHNWLIELMRLDPLLKEDLRVYRSPWRRDLRPMRGILVGTHAFLLLTEYMAAKWRSRSDPLRVIAQRTILEQKRATAGVRKVARFARWTDAGAGFRDTLFARAAEVTEAVAGLKKVPGDWAGPLVPHEWPCLMDD